VLLLRLALGPADFGVEGAEDDLAVLLRGV
jgi:hypothetical protein